MAETQAHLKGLRSKYIFRGENFFFFIICLKKLFWVQQNLEEAQKIWGTLPPNPSLWTGYGPAKTEKLLHSPEFSMNLSKYSNPDFKTSIC